MTRRSGDNSMREGLPSDKKKKPVTFRKMLEKMVSGRSLASQLFPHHFSSSSPPRAELISRRGPIGFTFLYASVWVLISLDSSFTRDPFYLFDIPPSSLPVILALPVPLYLLIYLSMLFMLPASQSFLARVDVWIRAVWVNICISEMDKAYRKSLVSLHSLVISHASFPTQRPYVNQLHALISIPGSLFPCSCRVIKRPSAKYSVSVSCSLQPV